MLPATFQDRYEIGQELGTGAMGAVFAVEARIPQHLAVKVINKAMVEPESVRAGWGVEFFTHHTVSRSFPLFPFPPPQRLLQLIDQEVSLLKAVSIVPRPRSRSA